MRKFQAMPQAVQDEIGRAVPKAAEDLVGMMKRLVPKDKGTLSNSIHYELVEPFKAQVIAGGTPETKRGVFDESLLVEYGTKEHIAGGMFKGATIPAEPARPYFWPSWRAEKKRIKGLFSRAITNGIKKAAQ